MEEPQSLIVDIGDQALIAFLGYLFLIVVVGILAARFSSRGISNFFIGGRKMNLFVVAMSAVVSGRSAWLLLGVTGMAYTMGLSALWATAGYIVAEFLLFYFYAPRIRRFSEKTDCITIPDFFEARFGDRTGLIRTIVALIIIVFMLAYVSAQFVAGGKTFSAGFELTPNQGLLLTAAIILFYTIVGGFLAVSITDTIQGVIMIIALLVLPFIAIIQLGGFGVFFSKAAALEVEGGGFSNAFALGGGALVGFLGIGLGSVGNPHIIARYMSISNYKKFKLTAIVGTISNILMATGAIFTGMVGRVYFPEISSLPLADPENLYPTLASQHLHPVMFGVVIASIFAAIMSTADSQLLVAASALVRDVYEKMLHKGREISQKRLVMMSRLFVLLLVIVSLFLALAAEELVFWLVLFAWAGLGAAFGPASLLALFWKNITRNGAIAGILSGAMVVIIWNRSDMIAHIFEQIHFFNQWLFQSPMWTSIRPALNRIFDLYELIPGFLVSLLVTIVVSLYSPRGEQNDEIFKQITDK